MAIDIGWYDTTTCMYYMKYGGMQHKKTGKTLLCESYHNNSVLCSLNEIGMPVHVPYDK